MNIKQTLQQLNDRLDRARKKLAAATQRNDQPIVAQFKQEIAALTKKIESTKAQQQRQMGSQGQQIRSLKFSRVLSKSEQADMGALKKSVKGLVVVHPMTALGREMGVVEVTGFAPDSF